MEGAIIGTTVRVISADGQCCRRGYIALKNDNGTSDIIYQRGSDDDEENQVQACRIQPLLPFECEHFSGSALDAKNFGNKLFEFKDFEAAYEYYMRAHKIMQISSPISVGKRVIVRIDSKSNNEGVSPTYSFYGAVVSDTKPDSTVDVIYDDCVFDGGDEEEGVMMDRVLVVFRERFPDIPGMESEMSNLDLQRAIVLNLSKTALKRGMKGWAVRWGLLAIALVKAEFHQFESSKRNKLLSDALVVSCRALLQACRPQSAKKLAKELVALEVENSTLSRRGNGLIKEIEVFEKKRQKDNRLLAKNVAVWVDAALNASSSGSQCSQQVDTSVCVANCDRTKEVEDSIARRSSSVDDDYEQKNDVFSTNDVSSGKDENCMIC